MKKQWFNIMMKCVKDSTSITVKVGEETLVGKIKGEGLAFQTCKAIQETVGEYFKVYYK